MAVSKLLRTALALAAAASLATPALAQAQNAPWLVRLRAVNLDSANKNDPDIGLSVSNKVIPEVDVSYFFTPNIATELILTYPQEHSVYQNGKKIGSLKELPPTLTLQYHFTNLGAFKPYVGAGLNYTRFSNVDLPAGLSVKNNSWGLAAQVGADYEIAKNTYLNLDIKYVKIGTDVSANGTKLTSFGVDPWLVGVGIGWRF